MRILQDLFSALFSALARLFGLRPAGTEPAEAEPALGHDPTIAGQIVNGAFRDPERGRIVPFKLYTPERVAGPAPVVLFSHGLGGSREAAPYLGHELARHGYYAFFIQHPGSDESILEGAETPEAVKGRMQQAMRAPANALNRYGDVPFVLDQIAAMNRKSRLAGRLDLERIGMVGHSFGARGTMAAAGQRVGMYGTRFKEPRIRAGVPLSPNVPTGQSLDGLYDAIDIPLLHITGTLDGMTLGEGDFDPETRTLPFQLIDLPDQYLLVLDGATHMTFSGRQAGDDAPEEEAATMAVALAVVLFFDAYLKHDAGARQILRESFRRSLEPGDRFEIK